MPKKIYNYNNFLEGFSENSSLLGGYAEARDIDPHREPGFIMPGWAETELEDSSGGVLADLIIDALEDPKNSTYQYALSQSKLYRLYNSFENFTNNANFPRGSLSASNGSLVFYTISGTNYLLYIQNSQIGRLDPTGPTFDNSYRTGLVATSPHPNLLWKNIVWLGDGQYVDKLENDGTLTTQALDLGSDWEITSLFQTENYIGVCAWRKMAGGVYRKTKSAVFFWDGVSSDWNHKTPVKDNFIRSSLNDGENVYLITEGVSNGSVLRKLTPTGSTLIKNLEILNSDSVKSFAVDYRKTLTIFGNRLLIGANYGDLKQNTIFAYGATNPIYPKSFSQPYSSGNTPVDSGKVGFVGQLIKKTIFASFYDNSTYYWSKFSSGYSANANYKGTYFDAGQRIRVNYVKFYFKPLVSADSVTPGLDIDYGTSLTLKDRRGNTTISEVEDGTIITSKRFDVKKECHAFRPTLSWTAGGAAFSKIVVDYDFVNDI